MESEEESNALEYTVGGLRADLNVTLNSKMILIMTIKNEENIKRMWPRSATFV